MTPTGGILVIKLSALGDFVQALGPMAAIRAQTPDLPVTLLTTAPYEELARASGLVDRVILDSKPKFSRPGGILALRRLLREGGFQRVYDLQTSSRSSFYYRLFWPGPYPEWSGVARGCSHPHANPGRDAMHTIERQAEQLMMAGVARTPFPSLDFADADLSRFELPDRFALIVPGGAAHRPGKRWPAEKFGTVSKYFSGAGIPPVLIGTPPERGVHDVIRAAAPGAVSLAGETGLLELSALARRASVAVGNDSGPMHVAAIAGTPSVVLYSHESDPALCAQRGRAVEIIRAPDLRELPDAQVVAAAEKLMARP